MKGIILLCANAEDALRWHVDTARVTAPVQELRSGDDVAQYLRAHEDFTGWTIMRTDGWVYDERAVGALRVINAKTPLLDPTGLLGTDSSGRDDTGRRHPVRGEPTHADRPIGRVRR
jgi:hypothetical protein